MRYNTHAPHSGFSLLEVMVALFVMALGMISLLTLFPLGAIQMGQALKDDRCAQTAWQADGLIRHWWKLEVVERPGNEDPVFYVMDNPNDTRTGFAGFPNHIMQPIAGHLNIQPISTTPSVPVAIDPIGWRTRSSGLQNPSQAWFAKTWDPTIDPRVSTASAGSNSLRFPRRSLRQIYQLGGSPQTPDFRRTLRFCTMMDDLTFNDNGVANAEVAGVAQRQGRYNWSAIVQRPSNSNRYVADLKILVFENRTPDTATWGDERVYATNFTVGTTQIAITVDDPINDPPAIRPGSWIMDGTMDPSGIRNANFYRVQGATWDTVNPNILVIDLQTPVQPATGNPAPTYAGQMYTFYSLAEVFDRPQLTPNGYQAQRP